MIMFINLKEDFPNEEIIINGGITSVDEIKPLLQKTDGVMIGRAAYHTPYLLADIEKEIFKNENVLSRQDVIEQLIPYVKDELKKGTRLNQIMRHTLGLFHGQTGASYWKRYLSENMCVRDADVKKIDHIMDKIKFNNVDTSVGNLLNSILANEYSYFSLLMALTAIPVGFVAGLFGIGGG